MELVLCNSALSLLRLLPLLVPAPNLLQSRVAEAQGATGTARTHIAGAKLEALQSAVAATIADLGTLHTKTGDMQKLLAIVVKAAGPLAGSSAADFVKSVVAGGQAVVGSALSSEQALNDVYVRNC